MKLVVRGLLGATPPNAYIMVSRNDIPAHRPGWGRIAHEARSATGIRCDLLWAVHSDVHAHRDWTLNGGWSASRGLTLGAGRATTGTHVESKCAMHCGGRCCSCWESGVISSRPMIHRISLRLSTTLDAEPTSGIQFTDYKDGRIRGTNDNRQVRSQMSESHQRVCPLSLTPWCLPLPC